MKPLYSYSTGEYSKYRPNAFVRKAFGQTNYYVGGNEYNEDELDGIAIDNYLNEQDNKIRLNKAANTIYKTIKNNKNLFNKNVIDRHVYGKKNNSLPKQLLQNEGVWKDWNNIKNKYEYKHPHNIIYGSNKHIDYGRRFIRHAKRLNKYYEDEEDKLNEKKLNKYIDKNNPELIYQYISKDDLERNNKYITEYNKGITDDFKMKRYLKERAIEAPYRRNVVKYYKSNPEKYREYMNLDKKHRQYARKLQVDYMANIVKGTIKRGAYNRKMYDTQANKLLDKIEYNNKWDNEANKLLDKLKM